MEMRAGGHGLIRIPMICISLSTPTKRQRLPLQAITMSYFSTVREESRLWKFRTYSSEPWVLLIVLYR